MNVLRQKPLRPTMKQKTSFLSEETWEKREEKHGVALDEIDLYHSLPDNIALLPNPRRSVVQFLHCWEGYSTTL